MSLFDDLIKKNCILYSILVFCWLFKESLECNKVQPEATTKTAFVSLAFDSV